MLDWPSRSYSLLPYGERCPQWGAPSRTFFSSPDTSECRASAFGRSTCPELDATEKYASPSTAEIPFAHSTVSDQSNHFAWCRWRVPGHEIQIHDESERSDMERGFSRFAALLHSFLGSARLPNLCHLERDIQRSGPIQLPQRVLTRKIPPASRNREIVW